MKKIIDLSGQKFGYWTVIKLDHISRKYNKYWLCHCVCGVEKAVVQFSLKNGSSTNCGCIYRKNVSQERIVMLRYDSNQYLKSPKLNKKANKNNSTGIRNINIMNGLYCVIITRNHKTYRKTYHNLEEAIEDKKRVLLLYASGDDNWADIEK
jgi:hypothetical protein